MRWSWKIATVAGIPVRVHVTFFLLLAYFFWTGATRGLGEAVQSVLFILSAFGCVVLHEFGHALTARRYGVTTRDITLLPIGGVARLDRFPRRPSQEVAIALAGPAVNVVIAALLYGYMRFSPNLYDWSDPHLLERSFVARLFFFNVVVTVFNLIPAFPMDGGRVLRALLAMRLEYVRATRIAANVGQGLAFLFGVLGLFGNPMLILIALFVFIGAGQESAMVQMNSMFDGVPVRSAMITDFRALRADEPIARAIELLLDGHQQDFPVLAGRDGEPPIGILARADLLKAIAGGKTDAHVGEITRTSCVAVRPDEMLEDVFRGMQQNGCPAVPVVEPGRGLVGMVTLENVGEFAMVQAALHRAPRHAS
ncbi:MAG TPA: site-2 protease family protein [Candidatus Saccharimonadales bacterium]|nr:site-2 protease family protein [Candidatus Saccharimonadales bacterium]